MTLSGPAITAAHTADDDAETDVVEADLRDRRQVDGTRSENAYTLGFRYSFEL